jgi:TRAP-type C4-dicarboxylate transport system permease small subunit
MSFCVIFSFVWSVYIGVITAFRTDRHVAIDVIFRLLPLKAQRVIRFGVEVLILALSVYMTYLGIYLCLNVGVKSTPVLRINYVYVNMSVVICFGLVSIFSIARFIKYFAGKYKFVEDTAQKIGENNE